MGGPPLATDQATVDQGLADRYGRARTRTPKKWRKWLYGAIAVVVSGIVTWVAYVNLGSAPIDAERAGFEELPGDAMSMTLQVTRDEPGKPGVCVVRVRDKAGAESGRREVFVPPGTSTVTTVKTTIKSIGKPVTSDVFGCSYEVPPYLSSE
ncbi:DUF4307 domain-containing protein [Amycolatopsis sp. CA-230715]|uniref:DUF4307 domain-containing protein n=1 Tax=Amycolatopsis sp. CA-230715 TaxID=2745196 RepID=UPI001C01BE55